MLRQWPDNFWVGYFWGCLVLSFSSWLGWDAESTATWYGVLICAAFLGLALWISYLDAKKNRFPTAIKFSSKNDDAP
jgi:apolipoprotein N-acyltransferase